MTHSEWVTPIEPHGSPGDPWHVGSRSKCGVSIEYKECQTLRVSWYPTSGITSEASRWICSARCSTRSVSHESLLVGVAMCAMPGTRRHSGSLSLSFFCREMHYSNLPTRMLIHDGFTQAGKWFTWRRPIYLSAFKLKLYGKCSNCSLPLHWNEVWNDESNYESRVPNFQPKNRAINRRLYWQRTGYQTGNTKFVLRTVRETRQHAISVLMAACTSDSRKTKNSGTLPVENSSAFRKRTG